MVGRCYERTFKTVIGVAKEYPLSLTVFYSMINAVVRVVLLELCGMQKSQNGLGCT